MKTTKKLLLFLVMGATIVLLSCSNEKNERLPERGLTFAENFENLPYLKTGTQTYQYSSTDPEEDQFNDYFHWLRTETDSAAVLADIQGPGSIYRIWSTGNEGDKDRIKIYIDGSEVPQIDATFNAFHDHKPLRDRPQVGSGAGDNYLAWWSYMPISFTQSCKIVRQGNFRPFYNITYHTYTDTVNVRSWNGKEDYEKLEKMWSFPEKDPKTTAGNTAKKITTRLLPKQTLDVINIDGSGYIASIKINNYTPGKDLRLKMYWDNETEPSVDAPVKWFFGSVDKGGDVKALGVGTVGNNGYCYFPMPYWKNARIALVNLSDTTTSEMDIEIQYNTNAYAQNAAGYFHAWANDVERPGKNYTCLKTEGRGHVIGMAKRMPAGGHACEADEIFYIDNRKFPDIYGTGEEDYANCAWWKNKYNTYPTHGHVGDDCYYRIHYPDVIVYEQALDMQFESWQNYYIASVVWYYEQDKISLVLTDALNIADDKMEKEHQYQVSGVSWSGKKAGVYPGIRIYSDSVSDDGRSFSGFSEFNVRVHKENKGMRLRSRTENTNFQCARIYVDGIPVTERLWYISKNNFKALWVDSDFEIPAKYTNGKETVKIRIEPTASSPAWTEYNYEVYTYLD